MMDQTSGNPPSYIITNQPQPPPQQQQTQQAQPPPQPQQNLNNISQSHPMMVPTSTNNPQQHNEVQRKQFIQKQLVLLLHAHKCQQREKQSMNGEAPRPSTCTLPHCNTMKNVLQHMTKCNDHKTCTFPHCVTSRQIILHWKQCNNPQCPICQPLKAPAALAKLNASSNPTTNNNTNNPNSNPTNTNNPNNNNPTTVSNLSVNKEWQRRVTQEMRNHLVQKIIAALLPVTDSGAMRDKRIINLTNYARRVEQETFEVADGQEEYFHKLAEKIYKIQKELEDRRERKRLQDLHLAQQMSSTSGQLTSTTNDFSGKLNSSLDSMTGDHGLTTQIRTISTNDYLSNINNLGQQTIKSEPLMTLTNRPVINPNNTNNSAQGTFTVTNVPSNENLSFLLNGDTTTSNSQSHDIDLMDTRSSMDTNQYKNEPLSPRLNHQV